MKGRDPLHAVQLIHDLGLYSSVFWTSPTVLKNLSSLPTDPLQGLIAATILHSLTGNPSPLPPIHPLLTQHFTLHPSTRPRLFLASALTPFKCITYRDAKDKIHPAIEAILRDGCKLGSQNNYLGGIPTLFSAAELLRNPTLEGDRFKERPERVTIGESLVRYHTSLASLRTLLRVASTRQIRAQPECGGDMAYLPLVLFGARIIAVVEDTG